MPNHNSHGPRFTRQGPKRRRRTRRGLPYGQVSMWRTCQVHFARERRAGLAPTINQDWGV